VTPRRRYAVAAVLAALVASLLAAGPAEAAGSAVVTTREVIGTSVQGRPIVAVHRSRPAATVPDGTEPAAAETRTVLVIGSVHGDEPAGMRVFQRLRDRDHPPAGLDLWLVRTVNPDGAAAHRRTNAHGVDLNRNFPYKWRSSARGATWSGNQPLSEPESVVLRDLVRRLKPDLTVTFHQPLFGVGANDKGMPTVRALARGMRLPVDEFHCTGVCYGTFTGWVNHRTEGLAVTVEFGRRVPTWRISRAAATVVTVGSQLTL